MPLPPEEEAIEPVPNADAAMEGVEPVAPPAAKDPFNGIPGIEAITTLACQRIEQLRKDQGIPYGVGGVGGWARKRIEAREAYSGNMKHRERLGGIFANERTNLSLNTPSRFIRLMAAKYTTDLIGARPFFATMPAKNKDKQVAKISKQVEAKVQEAIWRSNLQPVLAESIRVALTEGERVIKLGWLQDETEYPGPAEVAVDATGQPIRTPRGQYYFRNDDLIQVVIATDGRPARLLKPGEEPQEGEGLETRLKKEPGYLVTSEPVFRKFEDLPQTLINWSGLHAAGLFCEDFLYPVNCASLRDPSVDLMAHIYDMPLDDVVAEYQNAGFEARWRLNRSGALAQASQPQGGEEDPNDALRPMLNIHETYFKVRMPGARKPSWLFIVIDFKSRLPIYAQYLGRMKMERPPFIILRGLESVPGRAWGMGVYEKFWDKHNTIDSLFVRASCKNASDSSVDFMHLSGIQEVLDGQAFEVGTAVNGVKKTYHIPANVSDVYNKSNPPYFRVNLNEMNEGDFELMVRLIESGELEFGYLSAANESTKASDGTTATEVRNVERTGNILHESSEALISQDIEAVLEVVTDIVFENADIEDFAYTAGEEELAGLNPDEIRNLDRDVRLLRSKQSAADQIETNTAIANLILGYLDMPPSKRKAIRDSYVDILTGYRVQDADDKLPEVTEEDLAAEAAAQGQQEPPKVSVNLSDIDGLAPTERDQILQKYFGIRGAQPEELMQMANMKHQQEIEKMSLKVVPKEGPPAEAVA